MVLARHTRCTPLASDIVDEKSMLTSGTTPASDEVTAELTRQTEALRGKSLRTVQSDQSLWTTGAISLETLCSRAGDAFDACARATFDALRGVENPPDAADAPKWMRQHYRRAVIGVAHAIRDAIGDSNARHAVAQTLQTRMLRAETRFRELIDEPPSR